MCELDAVKISYLLEGGKVSSKSYSFQPGWKKILSCEVAE